MNRRKATLITIIGAIVGIPAVAFAVSFIFGSFGGTTGFTDTTGGAKITAVSGIKGETGVDCSSATLTGDTTFEVSPTAPRLALQGQPAKVTPGSCNVTISIDNTGTEPLRPTVTTSQAPAGWTFVAGEGGKTSTIAPKSSGRLLLVITASAEAASGGISGQLNSDVGATKTDPAAG